MLRRQLLRTTRTLTRSAISARPCASLLRTQPVLRRPLSTPLALRTHSTSAQLKVDKPELMIAFTCKKCSTRSSHVMSKQAYTKGTVLITCPGCKNRHLIADHLKIFSDDRITIEDILSAKGESVSSTTDDLVFDDIPEKLKSIIGHHAKDAPESMKKEEDDGPKILPEGETK